MKKRMIMLFGVLLLACTLTVGAAEVKTPQQEAAETLHTLGLFAGTNLGYELDRAPSRQESIVMLVRLLGKEVEAKAGTWTTPFTDVPTWAAPYVGYAYKNGLTSGVGTTTFGATLPIDANQYTTMLLRALHYQDGKNGDFTWDAAATFGATLGFPGAPKGKFLRGDVAELSLNVLSKPFKDSSATMAERLVADGAVPKAAAEAAGLLKQKTTWEGTKLRIPWNASPEYLLREVPEARYGFEAETVYFDHSDPLFKEEKPGWVKSSSFLSSFLENVLYFKKNGTNALDLREKQAPLEGGYFYAITRYDTFERWDKNLLAMRDLPGGKTEPFYAQVHSYGYYAITDKDCNLLGYIRGAKPGEDLWFETDFTKDAKIIGTGIDTHIAPKMIAFVFEGKNDIPTFSFGPELISTRVQDHVVRPVILGDTSVKLESCQSSMTVYAPYEKEQVRLEIFKLFSPCFRGDNETLGTRINSVGALECQDGQWGYLSDKDFSVNQGQAAQYLLVSQDGTPLAYCLEVPNI